MNKFNNIENMIGNTPLLEISLSYKNKPMKVYAKAEYYNLSGSIKDRVAHYIMKKAYEKGTINKEDIIVEATSGNTGIAFCAMGAYLGHKVVIYMPDWMSQERIRLMESYGAKIRLVSKEEGGFLGSIAMSEQLAKEGGAFLPGQFSNPENIDTHYYTTGEEIARQLEALGLKADGVVAGVGTGGTIMGLTRRLREDNKNCKGFPLEPLNSPTLSTGYKVGKHRIQGISDEFIPSILDLNYLDSVVSVDDIDSIIMAKRLCSELGIGVGISSGANLLGAVKALYEMGENATMVTVFADDNKKYLSTDYSEHFNMEESYMTQDIKLLGVKAYK